MGFLSLVSPNSRSPAPSTNGNIHQPQLVDEVVLDQRVHEPGAAVDDDVAGYLIPQLRDLVTTSPFSTVEFVHSASSRVEDTTYLGRPFSLSAHSPLRDSHRAANHSSLRRPISRASAPSASSCSTAAHASRSLVPDLAEPAAQPETLLTGRVLDDSVERDVLTDHDLSHVAVLLWPALSATTDADTAALENGRRRSRPSPPLGRCLSARRRRDKVREDDKGSAASLTRQRLITSECREGLAARRRRRRSTCIKGAPKKLPGAGAFARFAAASTGRLGRRR